MRFNRLLRLIAFSGKAHRGSPASGRVTTKMPDADAPSQVKRTSDFGRYLPLSAPPPRLLPFRQHGGGTMRAARPVPLTLLAALAALAVAAALFAIYVYPAYAQEGSAPDKPTGAWKPTATHDSGDPQLGRPPGRLSITGYVILRRARVNDHRRRLQCIGGGHRHARRTTYTDDDRGGPAPPTPTASRRSTSMGRASGPAGFTSTPRRLPSPTSPGASKPPRPTAQVVLTWDDPEDDSITGYVILRRVRVNDTGGDFSVLVANTESAATTYTDTTVAASTTYTYRIKAINEHGTSERSRWFHVDTPAPPEPPSNNPATGSPAITGTAQVGETLTVDTSGITDEDGLEDAAFSYQWLTDSTAISGATANAYTLVEADEGEAVTVLVNFTDDAGNDETLTSAATAAVAAGSGTAANSAATGAPIITGTVQVGETLRVDTSGIADEDGLEDAAFSYQWLADGTAISGATANAYMLVAADEGKAITVRVSFTDDAGNEESLTSAATAAVAANPRSRRTQPQGHRSHRVHYRPGDPHLGETLTVDDESITGYDGPGRRIRVQRSVAADFSVLVSNTETAATTYTPIDSRWRPAPPTRYRIKAINQHGACSDAVPLVPHRRPRHRRSPKRPRSRTTARPPARPPSVARCRWGRHSRRTRRASPTRTGLATSAYELPVACGRLRPYRERRQHHLHPGGCRRGQGHQGAGLLHRRRRQRRDADQ